MSHAGREKRGREQQEEKKKKGGGQREMETDKVRVKETGSEPETRPQKSNYRSSREGVGPAPRHRFKQHKALPDMYSQARTHAWEQKLLMSKRRRWVEKEKTMSDNQTGKEASMS